MDKIFYPSSVLVVGVSDKPTNLGRAISGNMMRYNYGGELHLLGRNPGEVDGHPIVASFDELPDDIDLAVILTPAATVPGYLEECGRKGIRHAIVEASGFSEFSDQGRVLEQQVLGVAQKWGMRLVGPNCVGVVSTESGVNTIFVPMDADEIKPGAMSVLGQSGGVVLTYAQLLGAAGLGLNKAVSVGNKVDFKEADYLNYFLDDKSTGVAHGYLESIDDGRAMLAAASQGKKPIVVYKSNTGQASAQIAHSHTAALANDDRIVDAAFEQFAITRARSFRDMTILSKGFSMSPVRGKRLAVLSRSGGHAIISADLASTHGFELPPYPESVLERAKEFFRAAVINPMNPLDLGTVFNFDAYVEIPKAILEEMKPDAILVVFNYARQNQAKAREIGEALRDLSRKYDTPIALCYFCETDMVEELERTLGHPVFPEVIEAMRALAASRNSYLRREYLRSHPWSEAGADNSVPADAKDRVQKVLGRLDGQQVQAHEAFEICEAYGIPVAPWAVAENAAAAVRLAEDVGYPLALKVVSQDILHKSDAGGVMLGIKDADELEAAILDMSTRLGKSHPDANITGYLLQKMASGGREVLLGSTRDRSFGPTVVFGLGGIYVEVFDDAAIRIAPITRQDAADMIEEPRGSRLLAGVRGEAPADKDAIMDCLLRLSQLVTDFPEINEVDINPLLVYQAGAVAVDARVLVG